MSRLPRDRPLTDDYARLNRERWAFFPFALVAGLATGGLAVAFRLCLDAGERLRGRLLDWAADNGAVGFAAAAAGCGAAVAVAVVLVRRVAPEAAGSGLPHLKGLLETHGPFRAARVLWVKFVSGAAAIGGGLGLGREGPTIQMGAAAASLLGRRWRDRHPDDRDSLLICGAAAGLAAAFNAPLAAVVFALEELQVRVSHSVFFATAVAALAADVVTRSALGGQPVESLALARTPTVGDLPYCVAVGVVAGGAGLLFHRGIIFAGRWARSSGPTRTAAGIIAAAVGVAALGLAEPAAVGTGLELMGGIVSGATPMAALLALFSARFVLTVGSYGLGPAGGIFAPMLLLGGMVGAGMGRVAALVGAPHSPEPAVWATAGMAAFFGAVVRCPLTGIVLLVEMTGSYPLLLPLLCSAFVAAGLGDLARLPPVYDALKDDAAGHK